MLAYMTILIKNLEGLLIHIRRPSPPALSTIHNSTHLVPATTWVQGTLSTKCTFASLTRLKKKTLKDMLDLGIKERLLARINLDILQKSLLKMSPYFQHFNARLNINRPCLHLV
jgi:hypothetical protein